MTRPQRSLPAYLVGLVSDAVFPLALLAAAAFLWSVSP